MRAAASGSLTLSGNSVATAPGGYDTNPISRTSAPGSSLWLTQNGGTTWTRQSIPTGVGCNGDCGAQYGYPLEWVSCAPSGPCWAGGNQLIGSHEGFASALLMTPAPGGTWRLEPGCSANSPCSEPPTDLGACPSATGCYAVNNSNPFGDGSSTVGIYTATGQNGPSVTAPSGLFINDIACPAARTCYTAGDGGAILRTTNGTKFTVVKASVRENLDGITCVNPRALARDTALVLNSDSCRMRAATRNGSSDCWRLYSSSEWRYGNGNAKRQNLSGALSIESER